jgi:hypothetical protein
MSTLRLASTLTLPSDTPVHRLAFIGTYNSGKSYSAMKVAEQMWHAGSQFVAIDPMGIWFGMRLSADGKGDGVPITIFGGQHGDIPIREEDGALVAEVIVAERISAIIDTSHFESEAQKIRFVHRFGERLYHLKKTNPSAIHIFLEEADEFVPQQSVGGDQQMIHVWNTIWKRGGNYGIGGSLITQRPQDINKKSLELSACYFIFNVTGANAYDAVAKTLKNVPEVSQLPELPQGDCLLYSPGWLQRKERVRFEPRETFHARFDPNAVGSSEYYERTLTPLAVESLRERFAEAVQVADENDPKKLRARIAELEKSGGEPSQAAIDEAVQTATAPLIQKIDALETIIAESSQVAKDFASAAGVLMEQSDRLKNVLVIQDRLQTLSPRAERVDVDQPRSLLKESVREFEAEKPRSTARVEGLTDGLSKLQQRILNALALFESVGIKTPKRENVAVFADASVKGGHFSNTVSGLRTRGLLDYPGNGLLTLTPEGRDLAEKQQTPSSLAALHDKWFAQLNGLQVRILRALIDNYPAGRTREWIAEVVNAQAGGGHFANTVSSLRSLGLLDYPEKGYLVATPLLFPEGLK